jgi:adenosylcobinamide-phosphate synthase
MDFDLGWMSLSWVVSSMTIVVAIAAAQLIPWQQHTHPMGIIFLVSRRIGQNLCQQRADLPAWLGLLLWAFLCLPIVSAVVLIVNLAHYALLLEAVLLWLCIASFQLPETTLRVYRYLLKNKKQLARDTLQPHVLRDTAPLSALGVAKACTEMRLLRFLHEVATPLFLYALGNVYLALLYRFTLEMLRAWNPKLTDYKDFGLPLRYLCSICQWPVAVVFVILLGLSAPQKIMTAIRDVRQHSPSAWFLAALGARLDCQFCGPVQYEGHVHRTPRVGSENTIKLDHLKLLTPLLFEASFLFTLVCIGVAAI